MSIQIAVNTSVPRNVFNETIDFEQKRLEQKFIDNNPGYIPCIITRKLISKGDGSYWVEMEVESALKVNNNAENA